METSCLPLPEDVRVIVGDWLVILRAGDAYRAAVDEMRERGNGCPVFHDDEWPWSLNRHPLLCGRTQGSRMNNLLACERLFVEDRLHNHSQFHVWSGDRYRFWPFGGMNAGLFEQLLDCQRRMPSRSGRFAALQLYQQDYDDYCS